MREFAGHRLTSDPPLLLLSSLACALGLNEAIVLQQVHYWLDHNRRAARPQHHHADRWWMHNTLEEWQASCFPFWSCRTIRRAIASLQAQAVLIVDRLPGDQRDRTLCYTIDYEALGKLLRDRPRRASRRDKLSSCMGTSCPHGTGQVVTMHADKLSRAHARIRVQTNNRDYTETNNNRDAAGVQPDDGEPPEEPVAASSEPAVVASLIDRLIELGVTETVAQDLVGAHSLESIERQLAALTYRGPKDPAGTLVAAIRGGWAMPAALLQEAADRARAERHAEETRRREEERARRREDEKDERAALERVWEELPEAEREAINAECGARLARESPFVAARLRSGRGGTVVKAMLEGYRWEAVRQRMKDEG